MGSFCFHVFILALFCTAFFVQDARGSRVHVQFSLRNNHHMAYEHVSYEVNTAKDNWKRMKIGSLVPTCTYNECRGCKYKCSAKQVPVEGNDPMNSPYHYRCVCHRW